MDDRTNPCVEANQRVSLEEERHTEELFAKHPPTEEQRTDGSTEPTDYSSRETSDNVTTNTSGTKEHTLENSTEPKEHDSRESPEQHGHHDDTESGTSDGPSGSSTAKDKLLTKECRETATCSGITSSSTSSENGNTASAASTSESKEVMEVEEEELDDDDGLDQDLAELLELLAKEEEDDAVQVSVEELNDEWRKKQRHKLFLEYEKATREVNRLRKVLKRLLEIDPTLQHKIDKFHLTENNKKA